VIETIALSVIVLAGLYFIGLGSLALMKPAVATRFLLGFASTARLHYTELLLRMMVGVAFVLQAPQLEFAEVVSIFGWLLVGTTAGLLLLPWRWHRAFARRVVPPATRYISVIGVVSLGLGVGVLWLVTRVA
jgi:hypothetical protein